jgi:hypothetical protein
MRGQGGEVQEFSSPSSFEKVRVTTWIRGETQGDLYFMADFSNFYYSVRLANLLLICNSGCVWMARWSDHVAPPVAYWFAGGLPVAVTDRHHWSSRSSCLGASALELIIDVAQATIEGIHILRSSMPSRVFVFCGRRGNTIKLLRWTADGLCRLAKRLSEALHLFPSDQRHRAVDPGPTVYPAQRDLLAPAPRPV